MAGQKFLAQVNGQFQEKVAVQVGGGGNANLIPALDVNGRLDVTMMPTGVGPETTTITTSEALAAGDFVNVWNSAGAARVRKADASASGKEAHGFVLSAYLSGDNATVYFEGFNTSVTGQTPGPVYLSATVPGQALTTPPNGSGQVVQCIGFAVATNSINFESRPPVLLA